MTTTNQAVDPIFEEGRKAFRAGKSQHECRYNLFQQDKAKYQLWVTGWEVEKVAQQLKEGQVSA